MVHYKVNVFFETIHKNLHLLNVQRVGQLNTLLAVIFYFWRLARLLPGLVGIGFCLVAMGLGSNCPFVGQNFGGSVIVALNLDEIRFRGRHSHFVSHKVF
jgi:hypothetical protein